MLRAKRQAANRAGPDDHASGHEPDDHASGHGPDTTPVDTAQTTTPVDTSQTTTPVDTSQTVAGAAAPAPKPEAPRRDGAATGGDTSESQGSEDPTIPLRGAAGRIVVNMEASLGMPTATSVRAVPAKLLEVNRTIVNDQLSRTMGGKVSFTHLIGYAVVKGLQAVPHCFFSWNSVTAPS